MKPFYRPTWIEVDLDAIKHNVDVVRRMNAGKKIFAVIKANAYGHGDVEIASTVVKAGVEGLAVSSLDEGIHLRESGIKVPILVLGAIEIEDAYIASDYELSVTAMSPVWIEKLSLCQFNKPLKVHIKLNTGMNRLGIEEQSVLKNAIKRLRKNPSIELEGLFTHFATADEESEVGFQKQLNTFEELFQSIGMKEFKYVHIANTATLLKHQFEFDHAIRLGIGLYGINPTNENLKHELRPALSLYSRLTQMRWLNQGEQVGYGFTYEAEEGHWMGVIPIGYADGWWRLNQGRSVVIEGEECEIIGRVCMDQMMVKLSRPFETGTQVTLIGNNMPIVRVAKELDTIPYEVLCSLSDRIPRLYLSEERQQSCNQMRFAMHRS